MNIKEVEAKVYELLKNDKTGHNTEHIERVVKLSKRFAETEGGDITETILIALLHDVDDYKLDRNYDTGEMPKAVKIMRECDIPEAMQERVFHGISNIGYSKRLAGRCPDTLESSIVSDADMCDAMGANGILRLHMYAINHGGTFFDKEIFPVDHTDAENYKKARTDLGKICVCHMFDKILKLPDFMLTETGKAEAAKRHYATVEFLYQLFEEEDVPEWAAYLDAFLIHRSHITVK